MTAGTGISEPGGRRNHDGSGVSRGRREALWSVLIIMATLGFAVAHRALTPSDESGLLPGGHGLLQAGIGVGAAAVGVIVFVRGLLVAVEAPALTRGWVRLPRSVRRAVLRRRDVPKEYRDLVLAWLEQQRFLCLMAMGGWLWTWSGALVLDAGDDGLRQALQACAISAAIVVVVCAPVAVYALVVRRAHAAATRPRRELT